MGLFSMAIKAGLAKKVVDEARKPQNQRKIQEFLSSVASGRGKGGAGGRGKGY